MMLNRILEIANINNVIDRAALVALTSYLLHLLMTAAKGNNHAMHEAHIVMSDIWRWSTRLCLSLLVWAAGALVITIGANLWRDHHLVIGVWIMVLGSIGTVAGNLDLLRVLSLRRFGERIWMAVAAVNVVYTLIALAAIVP
jgi:hypothetical protein